jgi:release factor glutamine methyltransferase
MTIEETIERARRGPNADRAGATRAARLLVAEATGRPISWVLAHPEADLPAQEQGWVDRALARYREGEPLPYILGWWEFYGRRFRVDANVLIPRPETESLVEHALRVLRTRPELGEVVDVGTGSGCLAVTLAAEVPGCRVTAIDASEAALQIARHNAQAHGVADRIDFIRGDLLESLTSGCDLIVANLPYVRSARLPELAVSRHEPMMALDGGPDGTAPLRKLLSQLPSALRTGGYAILEIDEGQGEPLRAEGTRALPDARVGIETDLAGRERILTIDRRPHR